MPCQLVKYNNDKKFGQDLTREIPPKGPQRRKQKKGIKATAIYPVGTQLEIFCDLPDFVIADYPKLRMKWGVLKVEVVATPQPGDKKLIYEMKMLGLHSLFNKEGIDQSKYIGRTFTTKGKLHIKK